MLYNTNTFRTANVESVHYAYCKLDAIDLSLGTEETVQDTLKLKIKGIVGCPNINIDVQVKTILLKNWIEWTCVSRRIQ